MPSDGFRPDAVAPPDGASILVVDDQEANLDLMEEILGSAGFGVRRASDGVAALAAVEASLPDAILLDVMMPGLDGFAVCRSLKSRRSTCFVPIVFLTALADVADKLKGLEAGADDFLNKPVHPPELLARVRSLVRIKRLRDELDSSESILYSMMGALENRASGMAGHAERVARLAARVSRRLAVWPAEQEVIVKGALLHDLGKLGLPDAALRTAGALGREEQLLYREHPELGESILAPLRSFAMVRDVVRHHHERRDGTGFPDGLSGDELSLAAEIVSIANAWDDAHTTEGDAAAAERLRSLARKGAYQSDLVECLLASTLPDANEPRHVEDLLPVPASAETGRVLLGDDTRTNREVLAEMLTQAGHNVTVVEGGQAVLSAVKKTAPDLVLVDVRMPDVDGFEVCHELKSNPETRLLPVILVTAYHELKDRTNAARAGADDFLTMPVNRLELLARVRSLLRLRTYLRGLEERQSVVLALASAVEARDPEARGHSERVSRLSVRLAYTLGLGEEECERIRLAGLLHDLGEIAIPESILSRPGPLSDDERRIMRMHPATGESICRPLRTAAPILPLVRHHHERWDGSGYPDGLTGDAIPLGAQIVALAEAFEAMTSSRAYQRAFPRPEALGHIESETSSGKWNPHVVSALKAVLKVSVDSGRY